MGAGALMRVAKVSWVVGWALVPRTCPPPPSHPRLSSRARSVLDSGVGRWGRGRERSRRRRAPFYPPSRGAAPKKKGAVGRGVEGGVIIPNPNPPLPPSCSHPWHGQKAQKSVAWMGAGWGLGRGGTSCTSLSANGVLEDRFALPKIFFGKKKILAIRFLQFEVYRRGKCCPFFFHQFSRFGCTDSHFSLTEGENAARFSNFFLRAFDHRISIIKFDVGKFLVNRFFSRSYF